MNCHLCKHQLLNYPPPPSSPPPPSLPATTTIALKTVIMTPTASRAKLPGLGRSVLHPVAEDYAEDVVSFATVACKQTSVRASAAAGNGARQADKRASRWRAMEETTTQRNWLASKQVAVSAFTPQCVLQHSLSYLRAAKQQSRSHQNILGVQSSRLREPLYVVLVAVCFSRDKRLSLLVTRESSAEAPKHVKQ